MKKLYHFGDSYGTTERKEMHFVEILSNRLGYEYDGFKGVLPGGSNELIFQSLLNKIYQFKEFDILFFNFSFFVRGCYYDKKEDEIKSTNKFYLDGWGEDGKIRSGDKHIMDIITYLLDYNEDYNKRLFKKYDIIFELLYQKRITVNYIFNELTEWSDDLLKYGNQIKFENGFTKWLYNKNYHKEESCHYTYGIQESLCDEIINKVVVPNKVLI